MESRATEDVESPIALRELEPSPVEETPDDQVQLPDNYFPPPKPLHRSTTFLGLGDHGPAYYLTRIQRYSSYAFSLFTLFHITNTSLIPLATQSIPAADSYLLLTRPYYQSRPFEPLIVVAPLALHILSGTALRIYRRQLQLRRYGSTASHERRKVPWPAISGISVAGYVATILVVGHATINRVVPLWSEGSSANVGLEYVAHGVARHPIVASSGFVALVGVSVWHMVWGAAKWLGWTPALVSSSGGNGSSINKSGAETATEGRLSKKRRWYAINGVAATVVLAWLAGGLGVVGRGGEVVGWQAGVYDELYRQIPILGRWF